MIGKIVKGTSFSGCVNYVLKEDKSRLLKAVGVYGSPEEIAECIRKLWCDNMLRQNLIKKGYIRIGRWTQKEFGERLKMVLDGI